jgi:hypothetical protein
MKPRCRARHDAGLDQAQACAQMNFAIGTLKPVGSRPAGARILHRLMQNTQDGHLCRLGFDGGRRDAVEDQVREAGDSEFPRVGRSAGLAGVGQKREARGGFKNRSADPRRCDRI